MNTAERYRGCLLGLAAGDALGTTLEFKPPGSFAPLTELVGGGPFGLAPGQWTDDTSMALCLAESLVERRTFDPVDQLERYVRWWREGHFSSTGVCFDIGTTTVRALARFEQTHEPFPGDANPHGLGNGCLMRLAPVPMFFAADPPAAVRRAGDSARTTHGARACVDASRYFGGLICGALRGEAKAALRAPRYAPPGVAWADAPLCPEVDEVAAGSFLAREPPAIVGDGYVVRALEAALWAFARAGSFAEGACLAVNLGDDADTTGAIYGQLAGAHFGEDAIPASWRAKLALRPRLEAFADALHRLAGLA